MFAKETDLAASCSDAFEFLRFFGLLFVSVDGEFIYGHKDTGIVEFSACNKQIDNRHVMSTYK